MPSPKFEKGKSGNPRGRPRKVLSAVLVELQKNGAELVKPSDIKDTFACMLSLTRNELVQLSKDENQSVLVRLVAMKLLSNRGYEVLQELVNRVAGKPKVEESTTSEAEFKIQVVEQSETDPTE